MADSREIKITISADGSAAITGMRNVGDETDRLNNRTLSLAESFKKNWAAISAGAIGAYMALQRVWSTMDDSARLVEKMDILNNFTANYGTTAEGLVGQIQGMSRGLIGVGAAANVATDAISKGFTPEQVTRMAKYSELLADTSGEAMTTADAFKSMEESLIAARERGVVKLFGATVDLKASLGSQAEGMSKAEKATAMFNLAMEVAEKRAKAAGDMTDSAADRMERFKNSINQAKFFLGQFLLVLGQPLMAVFNTALTFVYSLVGGFWNVASSLTSITDLLGITSGKSEEYAKRADEWVTRSANQAIQAKENIVGAWEALKNFGQMTSGGGGKGGPSVTMGGAGENKANLDKLADMYRKYIDEREALQAAELDREIVNVDKWLHEQEAALTKAGATDRERNAMRELYEAKHALAVEAKGKKISEIEVAYWTKQNDEYRKAIAERIRMEYEGEEQRAKLESDSALGYLKAWGASENEVIRQRATGELVALNIQQERIKAMAQEAETQEEFLALRKEYEKTELDIEAVKARTLAGLDARRIEIEREIADLTRQQRDLIFQTQAANAQEAFDRAGGPIQGRDMGMLLSIEAAQDPYTKQYEQFSNNQDAMIMKMEESLRIREEMMRLSGASEVNIAAATAEQKAQISSAYGQYDVQYDAMVQNQKAAQVMAYANIAQNIGSALISMSGNHAKAQFIVAKAVAVAMAIVQAHVAAISAAAAVAGVPIVGPALAAAAYSKWMTIGYINAALIGATAIGQLAMGGGGVGGSIGAGGGISALPSSPTVPAVAPDKEKSPPVVNVHIYGNVVDHDAFARELIPSINKAIADGVAA